MIAMAACSPASMNLRPASFVTWMPSGALRAMISGERHRTLDLLTGRHDLLHETDPMGLGCGELVAQQQVIHRIAPPRRG